ncbi:MAG: cytochrome c peroxidase, partial [Planctomycetota bacterium]
LTTVQPLKLASNLPTRLQNFIAGKTYPDMFQLAYGTTVLTELNVTQAIASYIRTLNSDQSKWDKHLNNQAVLTPQEQLGLTLFTAPVGNAAACSSRHGDFESTVTSTGPIAGQMSQSMSGGYFSSLIPIRLVFHNGAVDTLEDAIEFYNQGSNGTLTRPRS